MYSREKSPEFLAMQLRDKSGANNPQFGVIKSASTIAKLSKMVSVYNAADNSLVGHFATVECKAKFNIGYDTLIKYIKTGNAFKGLIFKRSR
jgi:hypothetical protein